MRVIIAGGGTGGHIYPALAIAGGLRQRHPEAEILYVGTSRGMEADLVPRAGFPFTTIPVAGLKRRLSPSNIMALWQAGQGFLASRAILRDFAPQVVVGTGGYVCGPVILAAALSRVPTLIHEQNALPGLTNRLLSRFATKTALTFIEARRHLPPGARVILTGLPVRPEILGARRDEARAALGAAAGEFVLVSFGGSLGAQSINSAYRDVVRAFAGRKGFRLFHATGEQGYSAFIEDLHATGLDPDSLPNVTVAPYFHAIAGLLAAADLVICRAGASTIAELTVLGLPSILIPYPYATGNHQEYNARALERRGAAVVIRDADLDGAVLVSMITSLARADKERRAAMAAAARAMGKPRALENLLDAIDRLARSSRDKGRGCQ
ncbi:MAG: undecaprenyldiphospho-muramoylpentapeptide beta-N-acetylglucosaminyltransferase [Bacillota bacterium]|nr:undecaprenyldiphospho-muramoylpentapeptide beta-N-acetylglucosaminyltransferase [Bacillota bacterium]